MDGSLGPVRSIKTRRIDLSADSHNIFRSRHDPLATPSFKKTELPMSSPVRPSTQQSNHAEDGEVVEEMIEPARSTGNYVLGGSMSGPSRKWDVEDVSDSQWQAIDRSTRKRKRDRASSASRDGES